MLYLCPETLLPKENTGAVLEGRRLSERPSGECVGPALTHPVLCGLEKGKETQPLEGLMLMSVEG